MASKAITNPFFRHVSTRGFATKAVTASARREASVQSTVLPNGMITAALDNGSPVTRVTIAFKAGSRYEPAGESGVAHVLRAAAGLSTGSASSFIMARKLAQAGATVTASGDREFIYYTLESTQDTINDTLECLSNMVSNQEFRPWEMGDLSPRLRYDIASLTPQARAVDLLHKAAYRRGLGNSLFMSPKAIGSTSSESIQHFARSTVLPNRGTIVVVGGGEDKASLLAQSLKLPIPDEGMSCPKSKFYGGELRKEMGGELTHVALAAEGAPAGTPESLALAIAAKALGNGPSTKWGSDNTILARAIGNIGPFAAAGFNVNYSDSGLYGVVLTVPKDEAMNAVKAAAATLRNPGLEPASIRAGRNQLKLQVLSEADSGTALAESTAAQALYTGSIKTPLALCHDIDAVSDTQVCAAFAKACQGRLAMAAVGNLTCTPYVDEL